MAGIPNTFSSSTTIASAEVNANFTYLLRDVDIVYGSGVATTTGSAAAFGSDMTINKAVTTGDILRITGSFSVSCDAANNVVQYIFREDASNLFIVEQTSILSGVTVPITQVEFYHVATGTGTKTYDIQWRLAIGGGTFTSNPSAGSNNFRQFSVEILKN